MCVLRWPSYTCDCLEKEMGMKRLYLIRHCAACHNHDAINIIKKAFYEYSGNVSMCLPETTKEITDARPYLLKMFKDPRKNYFSDAKQVPFFQLGSQLGEKTFSKKQNMS